MSEVYQCFIGGLSGRTTAKGLENAFRKYGHVTDAKVIMDKESGRSRGFGFVTYNEKEAMEDAIELLNDQELDGCPITVVEAPPGMGRDCGRDGDFGRGRGHGHDCGGVQGSNSGECFKCGKYGPFARDCPSDDGGRGDRYRSRVGRYGSREDRYGGRGGGDRGSHYGCVCNGDRYDGGGHNRDGDSHSGSGSYRYSRDYSSSHYGSVRSGDRHNGGGHNRDGESHSGSGSYHYSRDYSGSHYGRVPSGDQHDGGGHSRDGDSPSGSGFGCCSRDHSGSYELSSGGSN